MLIFSVIFLVILKKQQAYKETKQKNVHIFFKTILY